MLASKTHAARAEEIFLAGLIHDLGILVQRQAYPDKLAATVSTVEQTGRNYLEVEAEILIADHQAFGEALAAKWRFPQSLQAILGHHHTPNELSDELYQLVSMIRLADVACCQLEYGFPMSCYGQTVDTPMIVAAGTTQEIYDEAVAGLPEAVAEAESIMS
jgi:HD-like signal output (HDOD) protein